MNQMRGVRLGDVVEVTMGQAPTGDTYNDEGIGLPLIAGAGDFGETAPEAKKHTSAPTKVCQSGDIVMSIRATIGTKVVADRQYCLGRGVAGLRAGAAVDPRYLWHWLSQNERELASKARGATFPQVSRSDIADMALELPPLDEQRRIAAILDKADALRQKRKRAIALLDSLTQSIFLEMFGDLVANSRGWHVKSLEDVCKRITVGIVVKPASYYREQGITALRSLNVDVEGFKLDDLVYFSRDDNEGRLAKTRVFRGDVVIVRTGQPGKAAVVTKELDGVNTIDLLIATPDAAVLDAQFLSTLLNSTVGKRLVMSEQRGQIQQHLNAGSLKAAQVPVPPIELQKEFSTVWMRLRSQLQEEIQADSLLDGLFISLQHRAFSGQL